MEIHFDTTPFVRTPYNYDWTSTMPDIVYGASLTVPDMSLTIPQIIERFTKGLNVPGSAVINIDADMSDFDNLNDFERIDMARQLAKRVSTLRDMREHEKAEAAKTKLQADIDKAIADGISKNSKPNDQTNVS